MENWAAGGWHCSQVWDVLGSLNLEAKQAEPHSSSAFLPRGRLAFNKTLQNKAFLAGARNTDVKANGPCYSQVAVWCVVRFWGPDESCELKSCEVSSSALRTKELWVLDNSPGTSLPIDDHIISDLEIQDLQSLFRIPLYNLVNTTLLPHVTIWLSNASLPYFGSLWSLCLSRTYYAIKVIFSIKPNDL